MASARGAWRFHRCLMVGCAVALILPGGVGCSQSKPLDSLQAGSKSGGSKSSLPQPRKSAGKPGKPKGPQTMGNLLLDSYIADLGSSNVDAQIRAARELGNMGSGAKSALPALEKVASGGKPKAAAAAKQAVASIRKR